MSEPKIRLAVLFGGRSGEHEESCKSAASILVSLDHVPGLVRKVRRLEQHLGLAPDTDAA